MGIAGKANLGLDERDGSRGPAKKIAFETLEPRLLLSADFMPIADTIEVPGETDAYVFTLDQATQIYVDSLGDSSTRWTILDALGENIATATAPGTNGRSVSAER